MQKEKLVKVTYNNEAELTDSLFQYLEENKLNGKTSDLIIEFGLRDNTASLFDIRTLDLLNKYRYYSDNSTPPAPFDSEIWFYTVNTLSNILQVRF